MYLKLLKKNNISNFYENLYFFIVFISTIYENSDNDTTLKSRFSRVTTLQHVIETCANLLCWR